MLAKDKGGRLIGAWLSLAWILAWLTIAAASQRWVLTAIPVGFLFGFFLQKGDLCGASAFSEVILARDGRKVFGIWVCIVVSMLAFAVGDALGLVHLNPKPFIWANFMIGGAIFGAGTVLAGGCVSGCLYKAAAGNLNSIAALIAMPVGIGLVEYGPLSGAFSSLKDARLTAPGGGAATISTLSGLPYWLLALLFAGVTLLAVLIRRRSPSKMVTASASSHMPVWERWLLRPWKPWHAGLAIGLLALFAYMSSDVSGRNYPLGVTHGVLQTQILLTESSVQHVYQKSPRDAQPAQSTAATAAPATPTAPPAQKKVVWWLVLVVVSLMIGSFAAAKLSGQARLLPKPPEQTLVAVLGGLLVGIGAALATGCVVGNIMSGWALMSLGTILFGVATILANWAVTYFYLMGPR